MGKYSAYTFLTRNTCLLVHCPLPKEDWEFLEMKIPKD